MATETGKASVLRLARQHLAWPGDPRLSALAVSFYERALVLAPDDAALRLELALAHFVAGQADEARRCCQTILARWPYSLAARFVQVMLQLPILYDRAEDILDSRRRFAAHLAALSDAVDVAPPDKVAALAEVVGVISPFFLLYQGQNDVALKQVYGRLLSRILAARFPQWMAPPFVVAPAPGRPIRVGFAGGQFNCHSVWKDILHGWLSHLDRDRFALFGYSWTRRPDAITNIARSYFQKFVEGEHPLEAWAQTIREDRLHVLIYPDVSTQQRTVQLSALRLAPVQATTWGTYVTSGQPTLDYFLSGALIEPPGTEAHYTETLVRLPNLATYYTPLGGVPSSSPREGLGLRGEAIVYWCGQSLFKYLPQYDDVFPRIARQVTNAQFVFLRHKEAEAVTRQFERRLAHAFADHGLTMADHVVLLPPLTADDFHALFRQSDVFLDSIGVGGCTTTLESLPYHLPVVTLPSPFLRGRMSVAILTKMGVTETVARDVDDYVGLAVRLGVDDTWRHAVSARMRDNEQRVYHDTTAIAGLEAFLEGAVQRFYSSASSR